MKKFIFLTLLLVMGNSVFCQRDALYYQYLFNYHILNPAFTGTQEKMVFNLIDRHQWVGLNGAPNTITFGMHTVLKNEKIGLGGYVYTDRLGPVTDFGFILTYAYILEFKEGKLSLGLQFGFKTGYIDWDKVIMEYMDDKYLIERPLPMTIPDANFGFYYYNDIWFAGLSTKHLFERYFVAKDWSSSNFSPLSRNVYLYAGVLFKLKRRRVYKPSMLLKYTDNGTWSFDINSSLMINRLFWLGISYRSNHNSFVFLFDININSKLNLGYSYDTYLGDIKKYNIGTHEIKIGYEVKLKNRKAYVPLYF
ncbi:MAG: type IX secretion system membrane protein PorP/SprF [Bacteroidales bacterium]|nr:type IX secretion system membrane protein PorP/SprF [Bacteroidales bacterium]